MRKQSFAAFATLASIACALNAGSQTPAPRDPRIGTWTLDIGKSAFPPGSAPRMQLRKIESRADGFTVYTQAGINAEGDPTFIQTTYRLDGEKYPEYTQNTLAAFAANGSKPNMNTYRLVAPRIVEIARFDTDGKLAATTRQEMSDDGRTVTVTSTARGPLVWVRQ